MILKTSLNGDRGFLFKFMSGIGAEIGVWEGEFSSAIIKNTPTEKLHLIDFFDFHKSDEASKKRYEIVLKKFEEEILNNKIIIHRQPSASASNLFPSNYFDWIYVDAGHTRASVKSDLNVYFDKVKVGGYILGDDYNEEFHGVVDAVNEFKCNPKIKTIEIKYSQYILKKLTN